MATSLLTLSRTWIDLLALQSVYACVLAGVLFGSMRLLRITAPAAHEAAWWLVLARLVLPPGWASTWSLRHLGDAVVAWAAADHGAAAVAAGEFTLAGAARVVVGTAPSGLAAWWPVVLAAAWLLGVTVLAGLLVLRSVRYRRIVGRGQAAGDGRLAGLAAGWRHRLGIRRPVRLVVSEHSLMPFTLGALRPVIHLPAALAAWPDELVEPVVAHELVHVARWDALRIVVANAVRLVYFFHPVAWLAVAGLCRAREAACDDRVLACGPVSPRCYGRSVMGVLRLNLFGTAHADAVLGLVDRKEGVEMRLEAIRQLSYRQRPRGAAVLAAFALIALIALPMATAGSGHAPAASAPLATVTDGHGNQAFRFKVGGPITEPERIEGPNPAYPEEARRARVQGVVVLETTILADGTVGDVTVLREMPLGLTEAAVDAVRQWRFSPATLEGEPVAVRYILTIRYRLDDDDTAGPDMESAFPIGATDGEPTVALQLGDGVAATRATMDRLQQVVLSAVERETPRGLQVTELLLRGEKVMVSGRADTLDAVAELVSHLEASPEFNQVVLTSSSAAGEGFTFFVECALAE